MTDEQGQQPEGTPTSPESPAPVDEPQQPDQNPPTGQPEDFAQTQEEVPQDGLKDRTRERIQQLSDKARTAEEALTELRNRKSVFDEFMPEPPPTPANFQPQYQPPQLGQYVDENGNVDIQRFDLAQQQYHQTMQMGTQQVANLAQQTDRRIQEREAYTKYPDLNPMVKTHDDDFKQLVADRMARNWAMGINKPLVEVADDVSRVYAKRQSEEAVAKKAVEQYKEAQTAREQGPVEKGRSASREEVGVDRLKEFSRKGSADQQVSAIAERLRRAKS